MKGWLIRGIVLAVLNVVVRTLLGMAIGQWPLQGSWMRWVSLAVVIIAAAVWGAIDGRRDRTKYPDSDDGADLTMLWLKAGVLGGLLAGILAWLVDIVPMFDLGDNALVFELTSGAAWTVLLIFVPAMVGVAIGRLLGNRAARKAEERREESPRREPAHAGVPAAGGQDDADTQAYQPRHYERGEADDPTDEFPVVRPDGENDNR